MSRDVTRSGVAVKCKSPALTRRSERRIESALLLSRDQDCAPIARSAVEADFSTGTYFQRRCFATIVTQPLVRIDVYFNIAN